MGAILDRVLPVVRELKVPLVTGLIWLLSVWIVVSPWVDQPSEVRTKTAGEAIARLLASTNDSLVTAIVLFVGYLLGELLRSAFTESLGKRLAGRMLPWQERFDHDDSSRLDENLDQMRLRSSAHREGRTLPTTTTGEEPEPINVRELRLVDVLDKRDRYMAEVELRIEMAVSLLALATACLLREALLLAAAVLAFGASLLLHGLTLRSRAIELNREAESISAGAR